VFLGTSSGLFSLGDRRRRGVPDIGMGNEWEGTGRPAYLNLIMPPTLWQERGPVTGCHLRSGLESATPSLFSRRCPLHLTFKPIALQSLDVEQAI